jgi:hypothetical protein
MHLHGMLFVPLSGSFLILLDPYRSFFLILIDSVPQYLYWIQCLLLQLLGITYDSLPKQFESLAV